MRYARSGIPCALRERDRETVDGALGELQVQFVRDEIIAARETAEGSGDAPNWSCKSVSSSTPRACRVDPAGFTLA